MDLSGVSAGALLQQPSNNHTAAQKVAAEVPDVRASLVDNKPVKIAAVEKESQISPDTEDRRFARVETAARQVMADFYPISDTRFTIFKDGSGRYITRFTNLKDGSVTFYPEPDLLALSGRVPDSLYKTNA